MSESEISSRTYEAALERSKKIEQDILVTPKKYRVLTGDRPTGRLHIGHYFGSLQNRVRLSKLGAPTMILIADYQVLTDHDAFDKISENTKQLVIDYLAAGINPEEQDVIIYLQKDSKSVLSRTLKKHLHLLAGNLLFRHS